MSLQEYFNYNINVSTSANLILTNCTIPNIVHTNISTSTMISTGPSNFLFNSNTLGNIFTTGGNIGVNTTSPGYGLDVNGSVNINKTNTVNNKLLILYDISASDNLTTATSFFGFGINTNTLRYQVNSTGDNHRFYCGATNYFVITSSGGANVSDKRYKSEIINIENALDKIKQLQGITFKMENIEKRQMGFIAQDVRNVIPEVVHVSDTETEKDLHYLSYDKLVPLLTEGIKEQQKTIDNLQLKNDNLELKIEILYKFINKQFPDFD